MWAPKFWNHGTYNLTSFLLKKPFVSQTYNYIFREYIIGRSPETSNICIEHSSLSRNHAKISVSENGSAVIQDLSSSISKISQWFLMKTWLNYEENGSFVNGKQLNSNQLMLLRSGTQLLFGENPQAFLISGKNDKKNFFFRKKEVWKKENEKK